MEAKVWFITGTSKGFGRVWAEAALRRGDRVVATARDISSLEGLVNEYRDAVLPLVLDVNDRKNCFDAVALAISKFGRIDVLINNAGFGHFGFVEEVSEADARAQIETNLFGSLWMIQAVLPMMRKQSRGHIIQVSSIGGVMAFPSLGVYHASKWAVEGMCESLSQEVAAFGIKTTIVEPAAYSTDWSSSSASHSHPLEAYNSLRDAMRASSGQMVSGDPNATAEAILKVVDADQPPLRLFLGRLPLLMIEPTYNNRIETWKAWREISESAQ